jgi:hypothetical protein
MFYSKLRSYALVLGVIGTAILCRGASDVSAQEAQKSAVSGISYGNIRLSGYKKITAGLSGIHVIGTDTVFELREQDRGLHRLHADDIRITTTGNGVSGDLSGNVHYTLLQSPTGNKLIDGTAVRALYKQSIAKQAGTKEDATVTLTQAHVSLFREGNEIATLNADQVVANQQDETVTGTGAVHITAHNEAHRVEVTADKITWNRRTNIVEATGKAHITYAGPNKKDGVADANHIKIDLKNLDFEIE